MTKETYKEIKDLLSASNPNKADIARKTGVSVVRQEGHEGGMIRNLIINKVKNSKSSLLWHSNKNCRYSY